MGVIVKGLAAALPPCSPPFGYIAALSDGDDDAGKGFIAVYDEGSGVKCRHVAKFPICLEAVSRRHLGISSSWRATDAPKV